MTAVTEISASDASGRYRGDFGWGRASTDADGRYSFVTVRPGSVEGQAPHIVMLVFMRGLLKPVLTRVYFPDEAGNAADQVLAGVAEEQRSRLVGELDGDRLRFDVRMQGESQTPFFTL